MDCSPAASSGAWEGLAACGHKPAFNLWLQDKMTVLSAGGGPAGGSVWKMTLFKNWEELHAQQGSAAPPASDANGYKHGYRAEQKRWCVDQPWHRLGSN